MILRWPRPPDPRRVLGPVLAAVLPFGMAAAKAQAPAAPVLESLKQRDQELDAARARQRELVDTQAKLRLEIDTIGDDRRALNQQLIESAARVRQVEAKVDATQQRLRALDERKDVFQKSLDERRNVIIEILAALQRVGRQPPPALLVRPEDALQALRTAIALGAVVPEMRADAEALAGDLADLAGVRKDMVAKRDELAAQVDQLAQQQLRLNMLIEERQKKQAGAEQALQAQQQHAAELAHQVQDLKDLIGRLEQGLDSATRRARAEARSVEQGAAGPGLAALADPGRLAPAVTFAALRGQLHLPVNGVPVGGGFGTPDGSGGTQKGLSLRTHAGAQITSPCDGWVVYAGPFRSYGQLLILNAGGGYHVLLAGMDRISVDLGQFVLTGEPVAVMGAAAQLSSAVAMSAKQPVLYVEFRKDGTPIDPGPWWATNESEKVRG